MAEKSENVLELLLHPLRLRLITALANRPMTPGELVEHLIDVPPATLYRHINKLIAGNILKVVEERPIRGTVEKVYALNEAANTNDPNIVTKDNLTRLFTSMAVSMMGGMLRYLDSKETLDPLHDAVSFRQIPFYLSDEEYMAFMQELAKLLVRVYENKPGDNRRQVMFNLVTYPEINPTDQKDQPQNT